MVEKKASVYDYDSVPSVEDDPPVHFVEEIKRPSNAVEGESVPKTLTDKDRERIVVAGVGSAVVGLLFCGPILAIILGLGGAYVAETNEDVRHKVGDTWEKAQEINQKHKVIERGVNGIGKVISWITQKVSGGSNHTGEAAAHEPVRASATAKSTVNK
jgi:hypothetical protein